MWRTKVILQLAKKEQVQYTGDVEDESRLLTVTRNTGTVNLTSVKQNSGIMENCGQFNDKSKTDRIALYSPANLRQRKIAGEGIGKKPRTKLQGGTASTYIVHYTNRKRLQKIGLVNEKVWKVIVPVALKGNTRKLQKATEKWVSAHILFRSRENILLIIAP